MCYSGRIPAALPAGATAHRPAQERRALRRRAARARRALRALRRLQRLLLTPPRTRPVHPPPAHTGSG